MNFKILKKSKLSNARLGYIETEHGVVQTPCLVPVATQAVVKTLTSEEVEKTNSQILIANTFHLHLKPALARRSLGAGGEKIIQKAGGIHQFMNWEHNLFTDSGGFQILDETFLVARKENGVVLNNPFTRKSELFTPEKCMQVQQSLGADVAMCLDDVPRFAAEKGKPFYVETLKRTLDWAARCRVSHDSKKQLLFGISQGGTFLDLREKGLYALNEMGFDGIALGGLAIGEPKPVMQKIISLGRKMISVDKPLYVMGLGTPEDIIQAIANGADIFDSVFPTRTARHGLGLTSRGRISIKNNRYASDFSPLDEGCTCWV